jgi:hypothetical protein
MTFLALGTLAVAAGPAKAPAVPTRRRRSGEGPPGPPDLLPPALRRPAAGPATACRRPRDGLPPAPRAPQ